MIKILFICHGNICRSTLAQSVFTHKVASQGLSAHFLIDSADTSTEEIGNPPHRGTVNKLRKVGIPLVPHRARQVTWAESPWDATLWVKTLWARVERQMLPWQIKSIFIIFLYLHLSLVFLLKHLIFQGFPTFEFSFLFKVSSQIFSYFLMFFPAILVNPLVKQASLPTGFFNYSLSDILLPLHHSEIQ